jgi:regulator of protease activity HflC (stomatin/prohibitin superfamily)
MTSGTDMLVGAAVEISVGAILVGVIYRVMGSPLGIFKLTKIQPFQRGVLMKGEAVDRVLEPGSHWIWSRRTVFLFDTRPKPFQLNSQDIQVSADTWVRVSLNGATKILDPARFVTASSDSLSTLYTSLRRLLTEAAKAQPLRWGADDGSMLAARIRQLLQHEAETLGLTVTALDVWEIVPLYPKQAHDDQELPVQ